MNLHDIIHTYCIFLSKFAMPEKNKNMVRKNITIRPDQEEFIKKNHLNLSRFVQSKLDEYREELNSSEET